MLNLEIRGMEKVVVSINRTVAETPGVIERLKSKSAIEGSNQAKIAAPVDTGRLRADISPRFGGVTSYGSNVTYGVFLDQPATRNPHYRRGPRAGQSTAGWFTKTREKVVDALVNRFIPDEVRRIESLWR